MVLDEPSQYSMKPGLGKFNEIGQVDLFPITCPVMGIIALLTVLDDLEKFLFLRALSFVGFHRILIEFI